MLLDVEVSRSFMKRMKSTGEITEPWGAPFPEELPSIYVVLQCHDITYWGLHFCQLWNVFFYLFLFWNFGKEIETVIMKKFVFYFFFLFSQGLKFSKHMISLYPFATRFLRNCVVR